MENNCRETRKRFSGLGNAYIGFKNLNEMEVSDTVVSLHSEHHHQIYQMTELGKDGISVQCSDENFSWHDTIATQLTIQ